MVLVKLIGIELIFLLPSISGRYSFRIRKCASSSLTLKELLYGVLQTEERMSIQVYVEGKIIALKLICILIFRTCKYGMLHVKIGFTDIIRLRIFI
jgi:hypothetical protein